MRRIIQYSLLLLQGGILFGCGAPLPPSDATTTQPAAACDLTGTWAHENHPRLQGVTITAKGSEVYALRYTAGDFESAGATFRNGTLEVVDASDGLDKTQVGPSAPVPGAPAPAAPTPAPPPTSMSEGVRPTSDPKLPRYACKPSADCHALDCVFADPASGPPFVMRKK